MRLRSYGRVSACLVLNVISARNHGRPPASDWRPGLRACEQATSRLADLLAVSLETASISRLLPLPCAPQHGRGARRPGPGSTRKEVYLARPRGHKRTGPLRLRTPCCRGRHSSTRPGGSTQPLLHLVSDVVSPAPHRSHPTADTRTRAPGPTPFRRQP